MMVGVFKCTKNLMQPDVEGTNSCRLSQSHQPHDQSRRAPLTHQRRVSISPGNARAHTHTILVLLPIKVMQSSRQTEESAKYATKTTNPTDSLPLQQGNIRLPCALTTMQQAVEPWAMSGDKVTWTGYAQALGKQHLATSTVMAAINHQHKWLHTTNEFKPEYEDSMAQPSLSAADVRGEQTVELPRNTT